MVNLTLILPLNDNLKSLSSFNLSDNSIGILVCVAFVSLLCIALLGLIYEAADMWSVFWLLHKRNVL